MARLFIRRPGVREWFTALCAYSLLIAPFGCQLQDLGDFFGGGNTSDLDTNSTGFFINSDSSSPILAGGRDSRGDEFFVFGDRDAQGNLANVDSIEARTAGGGRSFILFEQGWPVYAEGANGSYLRISYTAQTATMVAATIEIRDEPRSITENFPVEIDLQETAERVAALVSQITGRELVAPEVQGAPADKIDSRSLSVLAGSALFVIFIVPIVALMQFTIVVMGQALQSLYAGIGNILQSTLLVIFSPLFLIAALLNNTVTTIEFTPFLDVFIEVPAPPRAAT